MKMLAHAVTCLIVGHTSLAYADQLIRSEGPQGGWIYQEMTDGQRRVAKQHYDFSRTDISIEIGNGSSLQLIIENRLAWVFQRMEFQGIQVVVQPISRGALKQKTFVQVQGPTASVQRFVQLWNQTGD